MGGKAREIHLVYKTSDADVEEAGFEYEYITTPFIAVKYGKAAQDTVGLPYKRSLKEIKNTILNSKQPALSDLKTFLEKQDAPRGQKFEVYGHNDSFKNEDVIDFVFTKDGKFKSYIFDECNHDFLKRQ